MRSAERDALALALACLTASAPAHAERLRIVIDEGVIEPMPFAIPDFIDEGGLPSTANIGNGDIWAASVFGSARLASGPGGTGAPAPQPGGAHRVQPAGTAIQSGVGEVIGDKDLKAEGKKDQVAGNVKQGELKDAVKEAKK